MVQRQVVVVVVDEALAIDPHLEVIVRPLRFLGVAVTVIVACCARDRPLKVLVLRRQLDELSSTFARHIVYVFRERFLIGDTTHKKFDLCQRVALRYPREIVLLKSFLLQQPVQAGRVFRIRGQCLLADRARALCERFSEGVGRLLRVCLRALIVSFNDALRQQPQITSVLRARRLGFLAYR